MIWESSVQSPASTLAETKAKISAPGAQLLKPKMATDWPQLLVVGLGDAAEVNQQGRTWSRDTMAR
jgi:hypothetical protein